jgi:predicted CXXCH cytochrome family protein
MAIASYAAVLTSPTAAPPMSGRFVMNATQQLKPGKHVISSEGRQVCVQVGPVAGDEAATPTQAVFRLHPPPIRSGMTMGCVICHEIAVGSERILLPEPPMPDACMKCHPITEFELTHQHAIGVLSHCQMCHDSHGGTTKGLLKNTREVLCATCHEVT